MTTNASTAEHRRPTQADVDAILHEHLPDGWPSAVDEAIEAGRVTFINPSDGSRALPA